MRGQYEPVQKKTPRGEKQRLNVILILSLLVAVVLVLILSGIKIYSIFQKQEQRDTAVPTSPPEQVESPSIELPVAASPVPTMRPKAVALTFDDGPSRANDGKILNALQKHGARATFFVLGDRARVDGDILQMYVAAGCEIGSHSWNHPQLTKIKWERVERQLNRTNKIVKKLTGGYQIQLLRPPYGAISKKMRKKLDMPMVLWSLDTLDWKSRNEKKIFREVKNNVKDGDIILMHNIYGTTANAVEKVVPWLQSQGYDVLTVSELMERKKISLEGGKAYLSGR